MANGSYGEVLVARGFRPVLWTRFLAAFGAYASTTVVALLALSLSADLQDPVSALGAIAVALLVPPVVFSGYAGQVADRMSKRTLLVWATVFELGATIVGAVAFASNRLDWLVVVVFLLSVQSTFMGAAQFGIVPEILPERHLSRANALLQLSTFGALIAGISIGGVLFARWEDRLLFVGLVLAGIAAAGTLVSLRIPPLPASRAGVPLRLHPAAGVGVSLQRLRSDRTLALTVAGICVFWFLVALLLVVLLVAGSTTPGVDAWRLGALVSSLAIGISLGSLAAGRLSGYKVELGLVPIGGFGMGAWAMALAVLGESFAASAVLLVMLGVCGGLFVVPLNALLQQRPLPHEKGRVIATAHLLSTLAILAASAAAWYLEGPLAVPPSRIVLAFGLLTLAAGAYALILAPQFFVRFLLWSVTHTIYRIRIVGQEHVPLNGPALLVCNHVSHVDGLLVGACIQRFVRFMVFRPYYELPFLNPVLRLMNAIPVGPGTRQEVLGSLDRARDELRHGHVVCIFAEGGISRTGNLLPFKRGLERIVDGLDVPVIPVYLDRLWGSVFSFKGGRFFWKRPERLPYPVTVAFGAPLTAPVRAPEARQAIQEVGCDAVTHRFSPEDVLHWRFIRMAKRRWRALALADATGKSLTFGRALVAALLLSRWMREQAAGDRAVTLLLPASVGGALANVACLLAGKVAVNLNFTAGREAMEAAIEQSGARVIITSRAFLQKAKLEADGRMRYLEEAARSMPGWRKLVTLVVARLLPARLLQAWFAPEAAGPESTAAIIFSSGSTGQPKGIVLSHRNVLANVEGMGQVFWVTRDDCIVGVLPFFHSFGFSVTLWFPLVAGFRVAYVPNPLDTDAIGEMTQRYQGSILVGTPTFYNAYIRRVDAARFASLRFAIVGAEKLREGVARGFREKFGLELLEGYGCTEMSPVVSVNGPDVSHAGQYGTRAGTVGHPLPGVAVKVVDPDSGKPLETGCDGLLLVKGPNRMMGYLDNPAANHEALRDGWYVTGDIAAVDEDGFVRLTDRLSRFSKIAGEMVPHLKIEEVASQILDDPTCVVTSVPDEERGERLVLLYTKRSVTPQELWDGLSRSALPKLWVPKRDGIRLVDAIPVLGTGKVDLRRVREMARE